MSNDKNRGKPHASSPNEIAASSHFQSPVWRVVVRAVILGLFMTFWGHLTGCAPLPQRDPYAAAIQRENSLRLLEIGSQLMINSGPRAVIAPPVYAPYRSTCIEYGYGVTNCRAW